MLADTELKPFTWSYTTLRDFETCPSRLYNTKIIKLFKEDITPDLERGNELHASMRDRIMKKTPLPEQFSYMEKWAEKLSSMIDPTQKISCELQLALNRRYQPCGYFARDVWTRVKIDYLRIVDKVAHIVDYKTGKPKEDNTQLDIFAAVVFAYYPNVTNIRADFLWTEFNDTSHNTYERADLPLIWLHLEPRIAKFEEAYNNNDFPATKCGLCRDYCPVYTCEHNGKRA